MRPDSTDPDQASREDDNPVSTSPTNPADATGAGGSSPRGVRILDRAALLRRAGGDAGLANEVLELYLEDAPIHLQRAAQALRDDDTQRAREEFHGLKGSSATMGAEAMWIAARDAELTATTGDARAATKHLERLELELRRLLDHLADSDGADGPAATGFTLAVPRSDD